jgi:hypothetical protein
MTAATRKAHGPSAGGQGNEFALDARPLSLEQCAAQDREERAKWAESVKIAGIEAQ